MSTRTIITTMRTAARRVLVGLLAVIAALALLAGPALATEGGGDHGEREKITLPDSERDRVGLVLLGLTGLAALLALENARRQLKGERDQATGKWRWR